MAEYTDLTEMIASVDRLKADFLFDSAKVVDGLPPVAEQHFLVAICLLSQAVTALTLADYARMRGD